MRKFKVRFSLDDEPMNAVVEYTIEAQWEDEAIAQAHERWMVEHPEDAKKPHTSGCVVG